MKGWFINNLKWFENEVKANWMKILMICLLVVGVMYAGGLVEKYIQKLEAPKQLTQLSPTMPLNINANGQPMAKQPDVFVNLTTQMSDKGSTSLVPTASIDPNAKDQGIPNYRVNDPAPKAVLHYNGHDFYYVPYTAEQFNFDPKTWTFEYSRESTINVNLETPQPKYSMGIGYGNGGVAVTGDYRIGTTPFQVWGYADASKRVAGGVKFTQYASPASKTPAK